MSTIELVDPELRDALALGPQLPLTAESLMRRRANALELIGAVPKPNLPDIATDEIHVESAFGAKPIEEPLVERAAGVRLGRGVQLDPATLPSAAMSPLALAAEVLAVPMSTVARCQ